MHTQSLRFVFLCLIGIQSFTALSTQQAHAGRRTISFNSGWLFAKGDSTSARLPNKNSLGWQSVETPHTWNDKDVLADGFRGYYRGAAWYKKHFYLKPEEKKRYFLRFEAINQSAEIYINGYFAGKHEGGYTAFNIPITPFLKLSGEQYISVRADNSHNENIPPLSADFSFFGGIYRPVSLITTGDKHFSMSDYGGPGIYITTPQVSAESANVVVEYLLRNDEPRSVTLQLETQIRKDAQTILAQKTTCVKIPATGESTLKVRFDKLRGFELWSPDKATLYYVESTLSEGQKECDRLSQPLGFRWFRFDAREGFFLNGKRLKLMGANRHQDRIPYGNALNDDMHRQDLQLLKDMGGNFLRNAHYPQADEVLRTADRKGLLVWEEIPLVNEVTASVEHTENSLNMLREMIKQHHNHPSIIIWAYMNEIYWAHRFKPEQELPGRNRYTLELARRLEDEARRLDPLRYTAMAMHNYPLYNESEIASIPMIAGWNLYHGWYYGNYDDFGKFMDEQHANYPERIHLISEYGAGSDIRLYSNKPEKFDFSIEEQVAFTQSISRQIMERPYIAGGALWNLVDFSSERRVDATSHMNNKGLLTADRKPKDAYYLMEALLSKQQVARFGYPFREHWLQAAESLEDSLVRVDMYALSNRKELPLYIDGKFFATAKVENGIAKWSIQLPEGSFRLSFDSSGKTATKTIRTQLLPFKLPSHNLDLCVNLGCNYAFIDSRSGLYWLPEQEYKNGSWGYIGGQQLYISGKVGTKEDIRAVDEEDPLYQSIRINPEEFRADVPSGNYEVEILMVDYVKSFRRFADEDREVVYTPGKRSFSISVNNRDINGELDLGQYFGLNVPNRLRFKCRVYNDEGISIKFHPIEKEAVVSAIRIRSTDY